MPAQPGSRIRNRRGTQYTSAGENHEGTLGCFVRRAADPGGLYLISAAHVIALNGWAWVDDVIEYQDEASGLWIEFARFVDWSRFSGVDQVQVMDAAIARVTRPDLVSSRIKGLDFVPSGTNPKPAEKLLLRLYGASSQLVGSAQIYSSSTYVPITYGSFNGSKPVRLQFAGQILYGNRDDDGTLRRVTQGGDSGALVVDTQKFAVGLHIARTAEEFVVDASICTPIEPILNHFAASLVTNDLTSDITVVRTGSPAPAAGTMPLATVDTPAAMSDRIARRSIESLGESVWHLYEPHRYYDDSINWVMTPEGLMIEGKVPRTTGQPLTVARIWMQHAQAITASARKHRVPVELIVATICTESSGDPKAVRREPGWVNDATSKDKVSVGLMQTLVATAELALGRDDLTIEDLCDPGTSIDAGTAYIAIQRQQTRLDPPVVACAYNAGSISHDAGSSNRWKMRQYPIGTGNHADRFVAWFNDCCAYFQSLAEQGDPVPDESFHSISRS